MGSLPNPRRSFCGLPFFLSETTLSFLFRNAIPLRGVLMRLRRHLPAFICLIVLFCVCAAAQRRNPEAQPTPAPTQEQAPKPPAPKPQKEPPDQLPFAPTLETHAAAKTTRYTASTGITPLPTTHPRQD